MTKSWYLIYTRQSSEERSCALLRKKKIDTFCPVNRRHTRHLGKTKYFLEPLFTSCIFARLGVDDFKTVTKLKEIINIAYWKDQPAVIQNEEIETIKEFVQLYQNIKLEKSEVEHGDVKYTNSPNYTVGSNSVSISPGLLKVQLPSIGFTMVAEADRERDSEFKKDPSIFSRSVRLLFQT